jgi:polyhydroxybutyrate depolymerase
MTAPRRIDMRRILVVLALLIWGPLQIEVGALAAAPGTVQLETGVYHWAAPASWDGKAALPLVLYLHGYRESGADIVGNPYLVQAVTSLGALLVAPDGLNTGWSFHGSPQRGRDDVAFLHAVVADAEARWPIDRARVVATGFSIGASMTYELACHAAQGFTAFLPMSGSFWLPYPERCESGPVDLRHVHGLIDRTMPMAGRPIGGSFHQGATMQSLGIVKALDRCSALPDRQETDGDLDCQSWTGCASGRRLQLCLHQGGHDLDPVWLEDGLIWAFGLGH